jgi:hypothetical protein
MQLPRPESRLSALEALTSLHTARIKEMVDDTAENLRDLKQDNKQLFEHVQQGFAQAHAYIQEYVASKEDLKAMATKEDFATLKAAQDARFSKIEATQERQEQLLKEILNRLPPKQ